VTVSSLAELERLLRANREVGGYQEFVVAGPDGNRYEISELQAPGNGLPLVIRLESAIGEPQ
jgi:hypothetical protein